MEGASEALAKVLAEVGILGGPARLLMDRGTDPRLVWAWHLWTCLDAEGWIKNPPGYILNRLRRGDRPPPDYVALAHLSKADRALLVQARSNGERQQGWPTLDGHERLQRLAPLWARVEDALRRRKQEQAMGGF
jgi:hypothetical protein